MAGWMTFASASELLESVQDGRTGVSHEVPGLPVPGTIVRYYCVHPKDVKGTNFFKAVYRSGDAVLVEYRGDSSGVETRRTKRTPRHLTHSVDHTRSVQKNFRDVHGLRDRKQVANKVYRQRKEFRIRRGKKQPTCSHLADHNYSFPCPQQQEQNEELRPISSQEIVAESLSQYMNQVPLFPQTFPAEIQDLDIGEWIHTRSIDTIMQTFTTNFVPATAMVWFLDGDDSYVTKWISRWSLRHWFFVILNHEGHFMLALVDQRNITIMDSLISDSVPTSYYNILFSKVRNLARLVSFANEWRKREWAFVLAMDCIRQHNSTECGFIVSLTAYCITKKWVLPTTMENQALNRSWMVHRYYCDSLHPPPPPRAFSLEQAAEFANCATSTNKILVRNTRDENGLFTPQVSASTSS